jgi:hypothetical protein
VRLAQAVNTTTVHSTGNATRRMMDTCYRPMDSPLTGVYAHPHRAHLNLSGRYSQNHEFIGA